jgi:two-component system OmpR family response regulator
MRILLVEDDSALGHAVQRALQHEGYATDLVRDAGSALHALKLEHFDLLLLDLGLPDVDGSEVIRIVRQRNLNIPVLILTARDALESRVHALDLGADDYMIKPVEIAELCARIRALVRRRTGNAAPRLQLAKLELDLASKQAFAYGRALDCSAREWSVLEYLALHAGQVISKDQLIQAIANWDQMLSANAIEAYVHRVRAKLGDCGVAIRTVRGFGYMLSENGLGENALGKNAPAQ